MSREVKVSVYTHRRLGWPAYQVEDGKIYPFKSTGVDRAVKGIVRGDPYLELNEQEKLRYDFVETRTIVVD